MSPSDISHLFNQPGSDRRTGSGAPPGRSVMACAVHSGLCTVKCQHANANTDFNVEANVEEIQLCSAEHNTTDVICPDEPGRSASLRLFSFHLS